jgi:CBS domain-containing protein
MSTSTSDLKASEIMTTEVMTLDPTTLVENAARAMFESSVSGMPVVDDEGRLIGVVSEYDIISKQGRTVGDIMSRDVVSVGKDTDPETIARMITEQRVRRIPVVDGGKVIGIISRSDLVRLFALTRWSCEDCGYFTRGFERLTACPKCGSESILLEREPPGM